MSDLLLSIVRRFAYKSTYLATRLIAPSWVCACDSEIGLNWSGQEEEEEAVAGDSVPETRIDS